MGMNLNSRHKAEGTWLWRAGSAGNQVGTEEKAATLSSEKENQTERCGWRIWAKQQSNLGYSLLKETLMSD